MPYYSLVRYTGDGSNKIFTIPFTYIEEDDVEVFVDGVQVTAFEFINTSSIQLTTAPANGAEVEVKRNTTKDTKLVDFNNGSILSAEALDLQTDQSLYINQEVLDVVSDTYGIIGEVNTTLEDHVEDTSTHGVTSNIVGIDDTQTLTNKTISLTNNTLTGTKAQFNAALSDADFATLDGVETLTNKTLTAPNINNGDINNSTIIDSELLGGSIDNIIIGESEPNSGKFTTINTTSTINGVRILGLQNSNISLYTDYFNEATPTSITGMSNVLLGTFAGYRLTTGSTNVCVGSTAGSSLTTGERNTAIGGDSLIRITSSNRNVAIGNLAGYSLTSSGDTNNTFIGFKAGLSSYTPEGWEIENLQTTNSIYVGASSTSKFNGTPITNEIVIGTNAVGKGNNTVVLGNEDITDTYLKGAVSADSFNSMAGLSSTDSDIKMNGTQDAGTLTTVARADHVHPKDTSMVDLTTDQTIAGNKTLTGTTTIPAGSAAAPSLAVGDTDSGLFAPSAGVVGITANGVEVLRAETGGQITLSSGGTVTDPYMVSTANTTTHNSTSNVAATQSFNHLIQPNSAFAAGYSQIYYPKLTNSIYPLDATANAAYTGSYQRIDSDATYSGVFDNMYMYQSPAPVWAGGEVTGGWYGYIQGHILNWRIPHTFGFTCTQNDTPVQAITSITRASNVVTATFASNTIGKGISIEITGCTDSSFNGTFTTTGASDTTLTWAQTAADATSSGGQTNPGTIVTGKGRWGLYLSGSANNYLLGNTGIGTLPAKGRKLTVSGTVTGSAGAAYSIIAGGAAANDVTIWYAIGSSVAQSAGGAITNLHHFNAAQATISGTVTTQVGFAAGATLIAGTNNFGFRGQIPSGTGRYNLYMDGTALNYLNGSLLIGSLTDDGVNKLQTPTAKIGTSTDSVAISATGITFAGTATVFDDLQGAALQLAVSGVGASINATENTLDFATSANLSDYGYDNYQMSHGWKVGSVVYPHIHWEQAQNNTPNWLLQYRWQKNGQAKTTAWTSVVCRTNAFTYTSGTLNQISSVSGGITPPSGAGLSDIIEFRILRDNANTSTLFAGADAYTTTAGITSMDIHIEKDTIGSNTEYVK